MKKVLTDVYHSWKETFRNDKTLFFVELISTMVAMFACAALNIDPEGANMHVVLSAYGSSALGMAWASHKRQASFMFLLMSYYFIWSVYGIITLI